MSNHEEETKESIKSTTSIDSFPSISPQPGVNSTKIKLIPSRTEHGDKSSDDEFVDAKSKPSKRHRIKSLANAAKDVPKRAAMRFDALERYDNEMQIDGESIEGITDNPAFNVGKLLRKDRQRHRVGLSKPVKSMRHAAYQIAHPKEMAKTQAARNIKATEKMYLTPETDAQLLKAHEDLARVAVSRGASSDEDENWQRQRQRVEAVEKHRDRQRVAWTTAKHVKRVKVVPQRHITYPLMGEYRNNATDNTWIGRYLGHMLLYLSQDFTSQYIDDSDAMPFKRGALIHHAQRFFVATGPWQAWLMNVRKVYLWEDPWLTGRWLALYLFLLKTGFMMTFFYSYIVYIVLKNRFTQQSVKALKESQERAMKRGAQVVKLSELVNRYGDEDWLDPLLDHLGPLLQQQLGDLADYLEILLNFYDWRVPKATKATLFFWSSCVLASGLTSAEYSSKMFWFVCGFWFFFSRPIASRYPKYRKAVSIFRWIYWEIPTHSEWAFAHLRAQAQETRKSMIEQEVDEYETREAQFAPEKLAMNGISTSQPPYEPSTDSDDSEESETDDTTESSSMESSLDSTELSYVLKHKDIIAFQGKWNRTNGRLIVHTKGLRFVRSKLLPSALPGRSSVESSRKTQPGEEDELWSRGFHELVEMHNVNSGSKRRPPAMRLNPPHGLHLTWADGNIDHIMQMRKRDEAFNTIIGFSRLKWMELEPVSEALDQRREEPQSNDSTEHFETKTSRVAKKHGINMEDLFRQ